VPRSTRRRYAVPLASWIDGTLELPADMATNAVTATGRQRLS
jgi:hypothetical protein